MNGIYIILYKNS